MTVDPKCHELAGKFLDDVDLTLETRMKLQDELAQEIQRTVEDFLSEYRLTRAEEAQLKAMNFAFDRIFGNPLKK